MIDRMKYLPRHLNLWTWSSLGDNRFDLIVITRRLFIQWARVYSIPGWSHLLSAWARWISSIYKSLPTVLSTCTHSKLLSLLRFLQNPPNWTFCNVQFRFPWPLVSKDVDGVLWILLWQLSRQLHRRARTLFKSVSDCVRVSGTTTTASTFLAVNNVW